jgi:hypothetical protein
VLLGFKRRFASFVEDGSKTHTIRAFRKIAPRVGEICHCYVDPRQKTMRLLGRWPCVRVEPITLDFEPDGIAYRLRVTIADVTLSSQEAHAFAWADGFRGESPLCDMAEYWLETGRLTDALDSKPWHGQVIHWKR